MCREDPYSVHYDPNYNNQIDKDTTCYTAQNYIRLYNALDTLSSTLRGLKKTEPKEKQTSDAKSSKESTEKVNVSTEPTTQT